MFEKPYYIMTFVSQLSDQADDYKPMADKMKRLAREQEGFLGVDSVSSEDGRGITVSYWRDLESMSNWKRNSEHREAQILGKQKWYESYQVHISKVEE